MSETLNIDEKIATMESNIEVQELHVARAEALKRLLNTDDFQLVIIEGLLNDEANRIFNLLMSPRVTKPEEKDSYMSQLETIKNVNRYIGDDSYLGTIAILGNNAVKLIEDEKQLMQEIIEGKGE